MTRYYYDALGHPVSLTDAYGNIRTWKYNTLGLLTQATDLHAPSDTTYSLRTYEYDVLGRVTKYTSPKGEPVVYTYDPLSRTT